MMEGPCRRCGEPAREEDVCDPCYEMMSDAWYDYHYHGGPNPLEHENDLAGQRDIEFGAGYKP